MIPSVIRIHPRRIGLRRTLLGAAVAAVLLPFCTKEPSYDSGPLPRTHTYLNYFKDAHGRYVYFHGLNVSGSNKFPANDDPCFASAGINNTGIPCSPKHDEIPTFVGKPFPIEEADKHFSQLRKLGFNSIRFALQWEGIQPVGPDQFAEDYLDYVEQVVAKAAEHRIYVLMDMHQDIFSRHLLAYYTDEDSVSDKETAVIESIFSSIVPPEIIRMALAFIPLERKYTNAVRGDGAPRWAIKAIMPEKDMDSRAWGTPRILGNIQDKDFLDSVGRVVKKFVGQDLDIQESTISFITNLLPKYPFDVNETVDFLPWTMWGVNGAISLDAQRAFAAFLAGEKAFPTLTVDGKNIQHYLQDAYAASWAEVAKRVKDYPNVIGYDLMNEPIGFFLVLTAAAAYLEVGTIEGLKNFLTTLFNDEQLAEDLAEILVGVRLLPPDNSDETKRKWGFEHANLLGLAGLNFGFDQNFMRPFYEKIGQAIQNEDPNAVIWIESSMGIDTVLGMLGGAGETPFSINMQRPSGINQLVYAPHWYPDIYPLPGFNSAPRNFTPEEQRFRDYRPAIKGAAAKASHALGNVPVVLGEFGTYFNYNGIDDSRDTDYAVSKQILDNYYEALEDLFMHHMQWCWSPENDFDRGEGWNSEDFSIVDPDLEPRAEEAYSRPYPTFLSGKPVSMRFYAGQDLHYFDPDKGVANPVGEFELQFESKETRAPTEIFIPYDLHYADGFYVWLSDGYAVYDHKSTTLFYYPSADEPGHIHRLILRPRLDGQQNVGWKYYFKKDTVAVGGGAKDRP